MTLIALVGTLVTASVVLWLINTYVARGGKIKKILNIAVIAIMILSVLAAFGVFDTMSNMQMGRIRKLW